ncbi:hypothetical protein D3C85_1746200 [compost metagenome]
MAGAGVGFADFLVGGALGQCVQQRLQRLDGGQLGTGGIALGQPPVHGADIDGAVLLAGVVEVGVELAVHLAGGAVNGDGTEGQQHGVGL